MDTPAPDLNARQTARSIIRLQAPDFPTKPMRGTRQHIDDFQVSAYVEDMSIRPLVILPDSQLRLVSTPVLKVDDGIRKLADDMLETMYAAPGIGLAAIQVAEPVRMLTIDLGRDETDRQPQVFINPEILWSSEETSFYEEGCLSIPDYYEEVERPAKIKVRYLNLAGEPAEVDADGLLATCLQHEIDHLNGVLFIDHISRLKRERVVRKFTKLAREKARA